MSDYDKATKADDRSEEIKQWIKSGYTRTDRAIYAIAASCACAAVGVIALAFWLNY